MTLFETWRARAGELASEVRALYLCAKDPRTPLHVKCLAALILGYALSPVDLIPDFIPVLGYLDDLILIPLGVALLVKTMPPGLLEECREKARTMSDPGKGKGRWAGAAAVLLIWAACIYFLVRGVCAL